MLKAETLKPEIGKVVSGQSSVDSRQWAVVSGQSSVGSRQWAVVSGQALLLSTFQVSGFSVSALVLQFLLSAFNLFTFPAGPD